MKSFCPNCEKEQEVELYSEVYECTVCREGFETKENPTNKRLAEVEAERAEWKVDAERLATKHLDLYNSCVHCGHHKYSGMDHAIDCPITLHRELVAKYGGEHE